MEIEFDKNKNKANISKHGIGFEHIKQLDWLNAVTNIDDRFNYNEIRYTTFAILDNRLYCLIWTERNEIIRPISFRKANSRERKIYEKTR